MAGNSSRRGAIKKTGKGNPTAGSGGRVKRGLEGRGPTPKAKDREGHVAYKRKKRAEKAAPKRKPSIRKGSDSSIAFIARDHATHIELALPNKKWWRVVPH